MAYSEDLGSQTRDLKKERDRLLDAYENLEEKYKKGEIPEEEYQKKKHDIERSLVEIMDRLAQMNFLGAKS